MDVGVDAQQRERAECRPGGSVEREQPLRYLLSSLGVGVGESAVGEAAGLSPVLVVMHTGQEAPAQGGAVNDQLAR